MGTIFSIDALVDNCPPDLFVLVDGLGSGGIELWQNTDGEEMLMAYSTFEELVRCCGADQPFIVVSTTELAADGPSDGISFVAVDLPLPDGPRYEETDVRNQNPLPELEFDPVSDHVWIPVRTFHPSDRRLQIESHPDESGELTLLAYTSAEQLAECCGPFQRAVTAPSRVLPEIAARAGVHRVLFNPFVADSVRHSAPVVDHTRNTIE